MNRRVSHPVKSEALSAKMVGGLGHAAKEPSRPHSGLTPSQCDIAKCKSRDASAGTLVGTPKFFPEKYPRWTNDVTALSRGTMVARFSRFSIPIACGGEVQRQSREECTGWGGPHGNDTRDKSGSGASFYYSGGVWSGTRSLHLWGRIGWQCVGTGVYRESAMTLVELLLWESLSLSL